MTGLYKFVIIKGKKQIYNKEITRIIKKYGSQCDKPVPTISENGFDVLKTSHTKLYKYLCDIHIVESLDGMKNSLIDDSDSQLKNNISLDDATDGLLKYAEYFTDIASDQKYVQRKGDNIIMPFKHIEIMIASFFEEIGENSSSLIKELTRRMEGRAHDNRVEMFTRLGIRDNTIYYQLNMDKCVEITNETWEIIDIQSRDIKFRPINAKADQVEPIHTDKNISDFMDLFRCGSVKEEFLVAGSLISAMVPQTPTPLINIVSPQGSGKTEIADRIKLTIDPISTSKQGFLLPNTKRDLILTLSQHPCFILDNVSNIKDSLSDIISASITGASVPDRKLYTDDDLLIKSLYTFVVFTGITDNVKLADLRSRTVNLTITYGEDQVMGERALKVEFMDALPELLGCIFNHLSEYLNSDVDVKPPLKYRMTDYYKILTLIEEYFDVDTHVIICDDSIDKSLDNIYNESIGRYLINKLISFDVTDSIGNILLSQDDKTFMNMSQLLNLMKNDEHSDSLYANSATLGKAFTRIEDDLNNYGIFRERKSAKSTLFKFEFDPERAKYNINDELYNVEDDEDDDNWVI